MRESFAWIPVMLGDRSLRRSVLLLLAVTLIGTAGYYAIEGLSPLDALYMTVITLSTVGYGEVVPLSPTGRAFTLLLITLGVGAALHAAGSIAGFVIEGRLRDLLGRKSMQQTIDRLDGHIVVCGFGRLGRAVTERLPTTKVVVIDPNEKLQEVVEELGYLFIQGSALEENVLKAAGIERARALIAATGSDPDSVYISLSARELQPDIQIHASAESVAGVRRLRLSGADQVISPHQLAGERIANALLRPGVVEFLELSDPGTGTEVDLEEIALAPETPFDGLALGRLEEHGLSLSVIAIKRGDDPIQMHPPASTLLRGGDRVVAVGDRANLTRFAEAARTT